MRPDTSVPVTTVPNPFIVNARSIGSRAGAVDRPRRRRARRLRRERGAQRVEPVAGASPTRRSPARRSRNEPFDELARLPAAPARASRRRPGRSWSATTMPRGMRSSRQMSKCSRVCGITDSSAATTSSTQSMPPTPASMFCTKRSWPGTSTNATRASPIGGVREAELDRDAARLLFLQAIGIDAGQRLDQRALAVIDVAGGADDDVSHRVLSRSRSRLPALAARVLAAAAASRLRRCSWRALALLLLRPRAAARAARAPLVVAAPPRACPPGRDRSAAAPCRRGPPARAPCRRADRSSWCSRRTARAPARGSGSSRRPSSRRAPGLRRSARSARRTGRTARRR